MKRRISRSSSPCCQHVTKSKSKSEGLLRRICLQGCGHSCGAMTSTSHIAELGVQARRPVAYRLLPFVFLMYVVNYIDQVNVPTASRDPIQALEGSKSN
jgi:hypothetical protein